MTREKEIRKAIDIQFPKGLGERTNEQALAAAGFELGVKWADEHPKNVWHDASEEPDHNRTIVITTVTNQVGIIPLGNNYVWFWDLSKDSVRMWAYINDLLPKGR